ncbi:MAG: hypothetical protein M3275_03155 [Thermoproteota archaeon]|nr:hypothetical protein [Thermoproteota archaeon]
MSSSFSVTAGMGQQTILPAPSAAATTTTIIKERERGWQGSLMYKHQSINLCYWVQLPSSYYLQQFCL